MGAPNVTQTAPTSRARDPVSSVAVTAVERWRDALVFVTGGSSGIGLAVAERLAAGGARLVLFARRAGPLSQAVERVERAGAALAMARELDVTDDDACRRTLAEVIAEVGPPRLVVHSAGAAWPGHFAEIDFDRFDRTVKTNLYGTYSVVSAVAPAMREHGGHIVTVSSVAGLVGVFGYSDYCAAKFGVIGFSEAVRQELAADGVKISVLCPPDTQTPGYEEESATKPEETRAIAGKAKILSAEAVADAMLRGVARGTFLIIPGTDGKLTHLAKRFAPWLVDRVIMRTLRRIRP